MENVIIIDSIVIVAFGLGVLVGTVVTGVTIGLMIPSMVKEAFNKLRK